MKKLLLLCTLGLAACVTNTGATLDQIVRGPTRVCLDRSAFELPPAGTIVEARRGSIGTHLIGSIGPNAFEITESARFAVVAGADRTVYEGSGFVVRQVGDLPGSYAVFLRAGDAVQQQPVVRIEHLFGTDTVTIDNFFAGFDPAGAAGGACGRTFNYSV